MQKRSTASPRRTPPTPLGCWWSFRRPRPFWKGISAAHLDYGCLPKNEVFQFFCYLFNLEEWASQMTSSVSDTGVDRQIVKQSRCMA